MLSLPSRCYLYLLGYLYLLSVALTFSQLPLPFQCSVCVVEVDRDLTE